MIRYMYCMFKSIGLALCVFMLMLAVCGIEDWLGITIFAIIIMVVSCISYIMDSKNKSKHNE